jgi:SAM-dependent methyltransferase
MRHELVFPKAEDFDAPLKSCRLCNSGDIGLFDTDFRGVRIDRCRRCGVLFMNPQYTDRYLDELYSRYNAPTAREEFGELPKSERALEAKRDANIDTIMQFTPAGRFLSIGTGSGDEIRAALSRGWTAEGYDVDAASNAVVARKYGVQMYSGVLEAAGLKSDSYDCVYMDQVLEHPKDPAAYLRTAHSLLKRTGVLYVGVPNITSISSVYKTFVGKLGLKPYRGRHYDTWHHLFYYSPRSLSYILRTAFNFQLLAIEGDPTEENGSFVRQTGDRLRRRLPNLDSSFRILARAVKP